MVMNREEYIECLSDEFLSYIFKKRKLRMYLYGDVAVLASKPEDLARFLYAVTMPKAIEISTIYEMLCREPSVSVSRVSSSEYRIVIADIGRADDAYTIASSLARRLSSFSPFIVEHIDVVTSYRSSEDGGYMIHNMVIVYLRPQTPKIVDEVLGIIEEELREFTALCRSMMNRSVTDSRDEEKTPTESKP